MNHLVAGKCILYIYILYIYIYCIFLCANWGKPSTNSHQPLHNTRVSEVVGASGAVASVVHCPVPMATMEELENELATKAPRL